MFSPQEGKDIRLFGWDVLQRLAVIRDGHTDRKERREIDKWLNKKSAKGMKRRVQIPDIRKGPPMPREIRALLPCRSARRCGCGFRGRGRAWKRRVLDCFAVRFNARSPHWAALSGLVSRTNRFPRALPWAGMECAVGAEESQVIIYAAAPQVFGKALVKLDPRNPRNPRNLR